MRAIIASLLVAAALTSNPVIAAYRPRCIAACEWDCEGERRYNRCMRACLRGCSRHPDQSQPDQRDQLIVGGIMVFGAFAVLALGLCIKRRRDRRISMNCLRIAGALEREAASYRAEAYRRNPDI
jgi:hypothetical protein